MKSLLSIAIVFAVTACNSVTPNQAVATTQCTAIAKEFMQTTDLLEIGKFSKAEVADIRQIKDDVDSICKNQKNAELINNPDVLNTLTINLRKIEQLNESKK